MSKEFILKKEHLKLLKNAYVSWEGCEYGSPTIDCKRPYGNSWVENDIRKILKNKKLTDEECRKLHDETEIALQIALINISRKVKTGKYMIHDYGKSWVYAEKESEK